MATVLDTFITRFGFETDTKGLKKAEKGLSDLKESAFKIAAVAGSILGGGFFLTGVAQAAVDTAKFADALGLTIEEMSTLEFIAQKVNVPIETLKGQAFNLAQALNEAATTGAGISDDLTRFGLSAKDASGKTKDLTTFIDEVRVKMQGLNTIEQADLADKLFFDEETIALLKATPGLIAEITKEAKALGILTREDAAKAKEFQDGLINLRLGIKNVQTTIGNLFFDKLTGLFETIEEGFKFFEKHEKKIVKALKVIGLAFTFLAARALIAWAIALGPPALIAAAITGISVAIAALIKDYEAFRKGNNSAIGDALKKWPQLQKNVDKLSQSLKDAKGSLKALAEGFQKVKNAFSFGDDDSEGEEDEGFFKKTKDIVKKFSIGGGVIKLEDIENINRITGEIMQPTSVTLPIPPKPQLQSQTNQNTNNVTIENINVDATGGNSEEIAANVANDLGTALKDTVNNFDSSMDK